jgi:hypothetical protein
MSKPSSRDVVVSSQTTEVQQCVIRIVVVVVDYW